MDLDRRTLDLVAATLSGIAGAIALLSALFGRNRGNGAALPSLLGVVGSVAWVMSALRELPEADEPA